jgi:hypothetical protein
MSQLLAGARGHADRNRIQPQEPVGRRRKPCCGPTRISPSRGTTEQELLAWLRQIFVNNLAKFVEQHMLAPAMGEGEVSIERQRGLEQSTV